MKTKPVTITLTPEQQQAARELSRDLFGRSNISGFIALLIEEAKKKKDD